MELEVGLDGTELVADGISEGVLEVVVVSVGSGEWIMMRLGARGEERARCFAADLACSWLAYIRGQHRHMQKRGSTLQLQAGGRDTFFFYIN